MSRDQLAAENMHAIRWWSPDELFAPGNTFAPRALPDLVTRLRRDGVPATPIEIDGF